MKHVKIIFLFTLIGSISISLAQENKDYIEFNDRKNILHGVYLGFNGSFGEINNRGTIALNLKLAYVANQKFEFGIAGVNFYSDQNSLEGVEFNTDEKIEGDLIGGYLGLHFEPIFFTPSIVNLSFPVLIGGGAVGYIDGLKKIDDNEDELSIRDWDEIFVIEPGINVLFNISRYVQLEAGVKYRFSSKFNLHPQATATRINGYSIGLGIKMGVFNLGRNRYKKNIPNDE
ncbi:hypothetical protein [Aquimarina aquimarini]|uniref:hypothetical protein n=1 Tax=Aquimarina aquimarini TaxID=1191734 RepID=UPI000D55DDE8|nr:hypothetical protein [Aquimarina aquimarini]